MKLCQQHRPDVVLMDITMPGIGGIEATRQLRAVYPETQVIAMSSYMRPDDVRQMLQAGAISYLTKGATREELVSGIRLAARGESMLAPEVAQILIDFTKRVSSKLPLATQLTGRELEVLVLMADGLTNKQIGDRLTVSTSTIKNHVSNILSKLGINTRTQAVALAIEHGLIKK